VLSLEIEKSSPARLAFDATGSRPGRSLPAQVELRPTLQREGAQGDDTRRDEGIYVMTVPVRRALARLKRVLEPISKQHWYLLRIRGQIIPFLLVLTLLA
jgi:hypothetical protein